MTSFILSMTLFLSSFSSSVETSKGTLAGVPDCTEGLAQVTDSGWLINTDGSRVDYHGILEDQRIHGIPDSVRHEADRAGMPVLVCAQLNQLHYFAAR